MKSLRSFAAGLFVLSLISPVYSADFSGLPVTTIELKDDHGAAWPNPEKLMPLLEVKPGAPFSEKDVRAGLEYLYLKGLFKDVRVDAFPDAGGVRIEYTLIPVTIVQKVVVRGNRNMRTERFNEILAKLEGKELREDKLPGIEADILWLYQADGYFDARVNFRQEAAEEPHRVILFAYISESEPTRIEEIRFTGNTVFSQKKLLNVMASKKGEPLRRDLLLDTDMAALMRLYDNAGYPAAKSGIVDIHFRGKKAYLTISGDEGPKVSVSFSGNHEFSSKKLRKSLLIFSEHDVSDAAIESSADKIKTLYHEKGYADVKVAVKKTAATGKLDLEFAVQEGPKVSVSDIRIEGNTAFTAKQIKKQMVLRESGWCWFTSRPYNEDVLSKDVDGIRDRYIDAGYLDARVEKKVTRGSSGKEAAVTVKISEGRRTIVRSVSFEGNKAFTEAELLKKTSLKPGLPFNELLLEEDRYRILSLYSNKGYLYAKVEAEKKLEYPAEVASPVENAEKGEESTPLPPVKRVEKGPANGTADIRFRIAEDHPVTIGKIILRGNESTKDHILLRELFVKPGGPYDYGAILGSQQRIYSLRYFGLVRIEPLRPGEKEYVKDMLLTVEERPAGAVEFGVGYGNLDRLKGFVEVSHRNLWGGAQYASLRAEGSDILKRTIFNYQEPWFLGYKLESKFTLTWFDRKEINSQTREIYYQTRETAVAYGVEKAYRRFRFSLTYQLEDVNNYNVNPDAVLSPEDIGRLIISSISPGVLWDLRDDPFNPKRGSLHGIAGKEALKELGSQADFTKATVQSTWFLPFSQDIVAALSMRAGMAWPHGETPQVPLHERYLAGGSNTIRGYTQDSVGPKGTDGKTPTGGDSMAIFNAELRTNPGGGFGLVFFTDAGNVWKGQAIVLDDLRAAYGAGIRYNTPVGPLRLDYGQKINRKAGESPGELHVNIGHAF
jgi:outer membrane protein insertion porin family